MTTHTHTTMTDVYTHAYSTAVTRIKDFGVLDTVQIKVTGSNHHWHRTYVLVASNMDAMFFNVLEDTDTEEAADILRFIAYDHELYNHVKALLKPRFIKQGMAERTFEIWQPFWELS